MLEALAEEAKAKGGTPQGLGGTTPWKREALIKGNSKAYLTQSFKVLPSELYYILELLLLPQIRVVSSSIKT